MSGHSGLVFFSTSAPEAEHIRVSSEAAHFNYTCPHCDKHVTGAVLVAVKPSSRAPQVAWLRCPNCHMGAVRNEGELAPAAAAGEVVEGLPADVDSAYTEARRNASIGAYTSCELMCRKILMHVAVDKGASEGESFASYVTYLKDAGYTTPPMQPWVDLIRQHANIATHEIPSTDSQRALGTLSFTTQLLRMVYEMEHKAKEFLPPSPQTQ